MSAFNIDSMFSSSVRYPERYVLNPEIVVCHSWEKKEKEKKVQCSGTDTVSCCFSFSRCLLTDWTFPLNCINNDVKQKAMIKLQKDLIGFFLVCRRTEKKYSFRFHSKGRWKSSIENETRSILTFKYEKFRLTVKSTRAIDWVVVFCFSFHRTNDRHVE